MKMKIAIAFALILTPQQKASLNYLRKLCNTPAAVKVYGSPQACIARIRVSK